MYLKVMNQERDGDFTIVRVGDRIETGRPPEDTFVSVTHEFGTELAEGYRTVYWSNPDTAFLEAAVFLYGTAYLMSDTGSTIERL